jgi:polyketide biosynthesis enoyl-CoA hydratase PksI
MNSVVKFSIKNEIAVVSMEDKENKNTFTETFLIELIETFNTIEKSDDIKVVVIHGFENYFCCGGTQIELIKIYEGKSVFTDLKVHDILLNCKFPVIAAMQGHAIGGGFILGCYADIMVLGKQCMYSANFMKYGFTPGFGSTYILPKRFGDLIGREMLFSARNYSGSELKDRGVSATIVDKKTVIPTAFDIAEEMTHKSKFSLVTLKKHFRDSVKMELNQCILEELDMHKLTFSQTEVRSRIEDLFRE